MQSNLKIKILRYSLYVITLMIFAGATVYTINGLAFSYVLYGFFLLMLSLIIWNKKKPEQTDVQSGVFCFLFNLLLLAGSSMLNGLDGSPPPVYMIWTVLSIAILPSRWSVWIIAIAVIELVGLRILHDHFPNLISGYADYGTELNDKTFIFIAGIIATGLLIRSYLLKNNREQKRLIEFQNSLEKANDQLHLKQEDLSKTAALLKESNERLEEFAYITSHDLKTPIRGARNLIQFTLEDYGEELSEDAVKNLEMATKSLDKMNQLVMDLLAFSRADKIEFSYEEVDLNALLTELKSEIVTDDDIEIIWEDLPIAIIDKTRIKEVFYNLISNGIKYNQSDKKVINVQYNENQNSISVKDNGIGIDPENHNKVFKFFQRLHSDKEYEGTGAGLALVKRILDRHEIDISLASELEKGSSFTLNFGNRIK